MTDPNKVYKLVEIVGTSEESFARAVSTGVERASQTLRNIDWFEVTELRGRVSGTGQCSTRQFLVPGGDVETLKPGDEIALTQSAVDLMQLVGKYMFAGGGEKPADAPAADAAPAATDNDPESPTEAPTP